MNLPAPLARNRLPQAVIDAAQKASHRFDQLPPRDRLALTLLSGFVALLLLIYAVILPALDFHDSARQNFQDQQALLSWLKEQQPAVPAVNTLSIPATTLASNPLTLVNTSAKDFAVKITRLQPENNGNLRVWMEDVKFEHTLGWLHHLQVQGLAVKEITVDQQKEGMVNVRVVF